MQPPRTKPWKLAASLAGGALAALLPSAVSGTAAAGNTVTGTFVVVGTLSLAKTVPAGSTVSVEADANVKPGHRCRPDDSSGRDRSECSGC